MYPTGLKLLLIFFLYCFLIDCDDEARKWESILIARVPRTSQCVSSTLHLLLAYNSVIRDCHTRFTRTASQIIDSKVQVETRTASSLSCKSPAAV